MEHILIRRVEYQDCLSAVCFTVIYSVVIILTLAVCAAVVYHIVAALFLNQNPARIYDSTVIFNCQFRISVFVRHIQKAKLRSAFGIFFVYRNILGHTHIYIISTAYARAAYIQF